jgi:hypothetical protein
MPLERVDVRHAGADALGILVPPGARTVVIVRPRTIEWDLLPVQWTGDPALAPTFCTFGRDEAAAVARRLGRFLEECDGQGRHVVETLGKADAYQIWLRAEELFWLVCARSLGGAYRPVLFADLETARTAAARLDSLLHPGPERRQQYYFNTQNFSH